MKNIYLTILFSLLVGLPTAMTGANSKTTVAKVTDEVTLMTDVDYIITDANEPFGDGGSVNIVSTVRHLYVTAEIKPIYEQEKTTKTRKLCV